MNIILKPVISEKTMQRITEGKYAFLVNIKANKHQIANEIKQIYKVEATKVNIQLIKPEEKIVKNRYKTYSKLSKKAIITLKKGQKIEGFEIKE